MCVELEAAFKRFFSIRRFWNKQPVNLDVFTSLTFSKSRGKDSRKHICFLLRQFRSIILTFMFVKPFWILLYCFQTELVSIWDWLVSQFTPFTGCIRLKQITLSPLCVAIVSYQDILHTNTSTQYTVIQTTLNLKQNSISLNQCLGLPLNIIRLCVGNELLSHIDKKVLAYMTYCLHWEGGLRQPWRRMV